MCNECGRSICAEACPNYSGASRRGRSWGRCPICDAVIAATEEYETLSTHGGRAVCGGCGRLIGELKAIRYKLLYNARRAMLSERRIDDRDTK